MLEFGVETEKSLSEGCIESEEVAVERQLQMFSPTVQLNQNLLIAEQTLSRDVLFAFFDAEVNALWEVNSSLPDSLFQCCPSHRGAAYRSQPLPVP